MSQSATANQLPIGEEKRLTVLEHIRELRDRLIKSVIAIAITSALSFIFAQHIFEILTYKAPYIRTFFNDVIVARFHLLGAPDISLVYIEMTEMLGNYMRVCLVTGIILAMPVIAYQFFMFVSPGLTAREKRSVLLILPWISLMFLIGVAFGYLILLPPATKFLLTFANEIATPQIRIGDYISLVTRMLLAIGLVFELPVVISFLARLGVVDYKWLAGKRKFAVILSFVLGAAITPTFDPINQTLVAIPLVLLYEISIWMARLVQKKRSTATDSSS